MKRLLLLSSAFLLVVFNCASFYAQAPVCHSLTAGGLTYSQDFDTLAISGLSSTVPGGFGFVESGTNANMTYGANNGGSSTGNTYSYGVDLSSERAFGGLQSSSLLPIVGACFTNNTGSVISSFQITYDGEQWRLGATARGPDRIDFQFSTDATSLSTGTWTDFDGLDFSSPNTTTGGILDGNAAANRIAGISGLISSLSIANGSTVYIRYNNFDASGSDDGLAVDNFNLTATLADTTPPVITYSSFGNTGSTANRVLVVTVTDAVAVASGGVSPRIYFRKNAGAYFSTQCSLTSGGPLSGTYDCTVDNALIGGVTAGDVVGYFVIAQDTSGSVASNPSGVVAANVNSVTTPPTPNTYTILQTFAGALSVGTGETITSLTNNGGLFQLMNAGTISGNTTVNITTDLTAETGTHSLNQQVEEGAGNWTIFFQASGGPRLISGSNSTALITLNGADRVTFSGLAFGPLGLTFRNTGDGATLSFVNDATSNSVLACTIEGATVSNSSGVVFIGAGPVSGNDNISITDSTIRDRTAPAGLPAYLIYNGTGGGQRNSNTTIMNNQLVNYSQSGIFNVFADNITISGNTISQTASRTTGLSAIQVLLADGSNTVSQNTIRDHSTTSSFIGLDVQGSVGTLSVSANRIFNIDNSTGSSFVFIGMWIQGNSPAFAATLVNNMISIVPSTPSSQLILGIRDSRTAGSLDMNHNSVLLGGTATGTNSWTFRRDAGAATTASLIGNLLFNNRTGGGVDHFAIGDQSAGAGSWSSDYNIFVGTSSTPANFFDYGTSASGTPVDFATWKTGPPARDANSLASVAGAGPFNVANMFVSPNDLHLRVVGNNPAINAGTNTGLTTDFDGQERPFNGAYDIGADEVQSVPTAADVSIGGRISNNNGQGIRNIRVTISGGNLSEQRTALTGSFGYFRFDGLRAGQTYVVHVSGKRYVFAESSRVVTLVDDLADIDFVGQSR